MSVSAQKKAYWEYQYRLGKEYVIPLFSEWGVPLAEQSVLDIGCAEGGMLCAFADFGARGFGIEISSNRLSIARQLAHKKHHERIRLITADFYNLPMRYNFSHYHFKKYKLNTPIYVCHFNESVYKPVDYIRDNYIQELNEKPEKKEFVLYFKKHYYEPLHEDVDKVMKLTREYLEKNIRE